MANTTLLCVGGSNIDLFGASFKDLIPKASNPGTIYSAPGGVMRNIVEDLGFLGSRPYFVTGLVDDEWARQIKMSLRGKATIIPYAKKGIPTGVYLAILDKGGDMSVSVCDNRIAEEIPYPFIAETMKRLGDTKDILIDTNLSKETIDELVANKGSRKVYAEAVSPDKSLRLKGSLKGLYLLKCARREAIALIGNKDLSAEVLAHLLFALGPKVVVVTDGERGACYESSLESGHLDPIKSNDIVNTTGCGDAVFAGLCLCLSRGLSVKASLEFGLRCAKVTIESDKATNANLADLRVDLATMIAVCRKAGRFEGIATTNGKEVKQWK